MEIWRLARATVVRGHHWGGEYCRSNDSDLEWTMSASMARNGKRNLVWWN